MINRLPPHYLFNPQMKYIFEAVIEDNTADDEPLAPKIPIIGRKNGPVTPPWEFYYTNRIVYGEGVPRSDKKLLQGCDCVGPCDPKSKTCACVQRQMAWTGGEVKGFLYKKEKLLHPHYPVFECNDACECSEECMNRVSALENLLHAQLLNCVRLFLHKRWFRMVVNIVFQLFSRKVKVGVRYQINMLHVSWYSAHV